MRTGFQWKELSKEYSPKSTVHDALQRWRKSGMFINLWMEILIEQGVKRLRRKKNVKNQEGG